MVNINSQTGLGYTKNLIAYFNRLEKDNSKNDPNQSQLTGTNNNNFKNKTQYVNESQLINQETSGTFNTKPKNYISKNISNQDSENDLSYDYNLEKISPKMRKKNSIELSNSPNESALTVSDISETTAAYILNKDKSIKEILQTKTIEPRVSEYPETIKGTDCSETIMWDDQETTTGTKQKSEIYWASNLQKNFSRNCEKRNSGRKNSREKIKTTRNLTSNMFTSKSNAEEIYEDPSSKCTFSKYSPNEPRKVATHTYETSPAEVINSRKVKYVRGEKVESSCEKVYKNPKTNIVWNDNINDFGDINDKEVTMSYDTRDKTYFQNVSVPHYQGMGKKLFDTDMTTGYGEPRSHERDSFRFKNRNKEKHETKHYYCNDQEKLSNSKASQGKKVTFRDNLTEQCSGQSLTDKLEIPNIDQLDNILQNETAFKSNHSLNIFDLECNNEKLRKLSKENSPNYPFKYESTAQHNSQFLINKLKKSNFDKLEGVSENQFSTFKNSHGQKKWDIDNNDGKHNVKPAKIYYAKYDTLIYEAHFTEQSSTDKIRKSNSDEVDNISENKISSFKNNQGQKVFDFEDDDEKYNMRPANAYNSKHDPIRYESAAQLRGQSSTNELQKSNFNKLGNNSQNETSTFKSDHCQKGFDIEDNDEEHNVRPAKLYSSKYDPVRYESTAQFKGQSSTNELKKSDFDKLDHYSQNETSIFRDDHRQKVFDTENNEKRNMKPFIIYHPQHHRLSKRKIVIGQYSEHMKFKNNGSPNPRSKRTEISDTKSYGSMIEDLQENVELNPNLNNTDVENEILENDVQSDITLNNKETASKITSPLKNSSAILKNNTRKHLKSSIIRNGKEIADLIVFCERDFDTFKSFYNQWMDFRKQTIGLLEQIVTIIIQSPQKNNTMKHVIAAIKIAATVTKLIPHPVASVGAKVADAFGGILSTFINRTDCKEDVNAKEFEIKEIFLRDMNSSSDVYIYGVQCSSQFQEARIAITEFHEHLLEKDYLSVIDNDEVLEFMNEITEYNSANTHVFYKRLRMCYERLIKCSNSEESRAFVRVFEDVPEAVDVIDLLPWKFDSDGFNNSIVQSAWDELFLLFQDSNLSTTDAILKKIQNCLFFLKKEKMILSLNVKNLFKDAC
ncbi:putative uncharacterized protein DDB_G0287457 [Parasteatoda tepidariorum]|uniref:putative uncharacterized protein DDB_G0287457 n=1 Tax=Parasteatoda tepidariorum TaxID=114398 RepID=UPI0039BD26D4